jgi:hypothetical protein
MTTMSGCAATTWWMMSSIKAGILARRTRIRFKGIAFRAGEYVTRHDGLTEPIDLDDGPHVDADLVRHRGRHIRSGASRRYGVLAEA